MPDSFFAAPSRKRRRSSGGNGRDGASSRMKNRSAAKGKSRQDQQRQHNPKQSNGTKRPRRADNNSEESEEIESDNNSDNDSEIESSVEGDTNEMERLNEEDEQNKKETAGQKRLRLAEQYLDTLKEAEDNIDGFDAADLDRDIIEQRLQKDVLVESGRLHLFCADKVSASSIDTLWTPKRGHQYPITSAVLSLDAKYLYTSTKNGYVNKWSLEGSKPVRLLGQRKHNGQVLSLSLNSDGTRLASGGTDKLIGIWDVSEDKLEWLKFLKGHRDRISAIDFRKGTSQLYSCSFDRTVNIYDAVSFAYIETLFGHQDCINGISALRGEYAVTAGSRDRTVRYWKVAEETQLVFRSGGVTKSREFLEGKDATTPTTSSSEKQKNSKYVEGSTDCVAMIDDTHFLSGGDSGTISLWSTTKKKPIYSYNLAHGLDPPIGDGQGSVETPRWITSLSCLPYGDVFASGSWDGQIRLWKLHPQLRSFSLLKTIKVDGVVNSLQTLIPSTSLSSSSSSSSSSEPKPKSKSNILNPHVGNELVIVAGIGQEHRLGRWNKIKASCNLGFIAKLSLK